jgi:hypothetical protein
MNAHYVISDLVGPELYVDLFFEVDVDLFSRRNIDFHFKHGLDGFRTLLETLQYVGCTLKLR